MTRSFVWRGFALGAGCVGALELAAGTEGLGRIVCGLLAVVFVLAACFGARQEAL